MMRTVSFAGLWRLLVGLLLAALVMPASADSTEGPNLELICPCSLSSSSSSSITAVVGALNRGTATSGNLVVRIYAHTESRYNYAASADLKFLADIPLSSGLAPGTALGRAEYQVRLKQPDAGTYYISFLLLEDNVIVDRTLMSDTVTFGSVASTTYSDLYFVEDPVATLSGTRLTVTMPQVGNGGARSESGLSVSLIATAFLDPFSEDPKNDSVFVGTLPISSSILAGGTSVELESATFTFDYDPLESFDYVHVFVTNGSNTLLMHTLVAPDVEFADQVFATQSVDFLKDSDGDGVADDNERLAGTDPGSGSSTPPKSYVDVLVVYSTGVRSYYNGNPSTRIEHLFEYSNQILAESGVDMELRLVDAQELAMNTSQNISSWLSAAENGSGVFDDLQARREAAGADLVVMFRLYDGGNVCGLATLGGFATQGLMERTSHISASFIEFDECQDLTMLHEIGHNMGLGHSYRQGETGTFEWSRGHGVDGQFSTLMAYGREFGVTTELPYFSSPSLNRCKGLPCGRATTDDQPADAVSSLNAVRFQVARYAESRVDDEDGDGVADAVDVFPADATEFLDNDNDGVGNNRDYDDDNDGMPDAWELAKGLDPFVDDAQEDADLDGITNLDEYLAVPRGTQYLQTNSISKNLTSLHVINTASEAQTFTGTLFAGTGGQLGAAGVELGGEVAPGGRLVLTSSDLEQVFSVSPWAGPAMLEVSGSATFEMMAKLESPSGLVSNTNCVRESRVMNIEGFDSDNLTFVRFINPGLNALGAVSGTLYDASGAVIGAADTELLASLAPKQQVWLNRNNIASLVGSEWDGEAMLVLNEKDGEQRPKLLNLNFINGETFFNFTCFENQDSGRVFLQTTSNSVNVSSTHIVNTGDAAQQFRGTLYNSNGQRLGDPSVLLHAGTVAPNGRVILTSADLEGVFGVVPWSGPAMLEVTGSGNFELMTKLKSFSGLVSNTNCVRRDQVHNIEGFDSTDLTFIRLINTGSTPISQLTGTLQNKAGDLIGEANQTLLTDLGPRQQVWLNRNNLSDIFKDTWNGEAMLTVSSEENLRLLNMNFINSETFFNFSCYEVSQHVEPTPASDAEQ